MASFPDGVNWPLQPIGPVLTCDAGPLQARVSQGSGHIELAGPDLSGTPGANVVQFSPPAVLTSTGAVMFGKVLSSEPVASGLSLRLEVGASQVGAQLTFADEGVLRYEVVDWGSIVPLQTAVAAPSTAQEPLRSSRHPTAALLCLGTGAEVIAVSGRAPRSGLDQPGVRDERRDREPERLDVPQAVQPTATVGAADRAAGDVPL